MKTTALLLKQPDSLLETQNQGLYSRLIKTKSAF